MTEVGSKIGHFMLAAGAVIEHAPTGKILVVLRDRSDFHRGIWEINYGRIDQHEEIEAGLRRELWEEIGLKDVEIKKLLRVWHFYRGEKSAETEIFGFTFHCQTESDQISLSDEHSEYRWVTVEEALAMDIPEGIKQDIELFKTEKNTSKVAIADLERNLHFYG